MDSSNEQTYGVYSEGLSQEKTDNIGKLINLLMNTETISDGKVLGDLLDSLFDIYYPKNQWHIGVYGEGSSYDIEIRENK
jgi:hypothetical protein